MAHADQMFSTSSTIKPAILLTLLRQKVDGEGVSLQTLLDLPVQIGGNQGPDLGGPDGGPLQIGNNETLEYLARKMIDDSNNWATNSVDPVRRHGRDQRRARGSRARPHPPQPVHDRDELTERPRKRQRIG